MAIKPPALKDGDTIGVMAPSSIIDKGELDAGVKFLEQRGFQVFVHPQTYARNASSAGTEQEKADVLHELFKRSDIKAIFAANGGNHSKWLVSSGLVDYTMVRRNPKIFMGFSDTTGLLNAFQARSGLTTFHGPLVKWMPTIKNIDLTFDALAGNKVNYATDDLEIFRTGRATGPLIGGNIRMVCDMIGTPYMPKLEGAILFLEDVGEEFSHMDSHFWRLANSGALKKISGLVIGQITNSQDRGKRPYGFGLQDIFLRNFNHLTIPVITNAPFGHGDLLAAMPIGGLARLNVHRDRIVFALDEPAVRI
jgi:muramoyltetrapeptide carboxypeptidase